MDSKTAYTLMMNGIREEDEPVFASVVRELASVYDDDPDYDDTLDPNRGE